MMNFPEPDLDWLFSLRPGALMAQGGNRCVYETASPEWVIKMARGYLWEEDTSHDNWSNEEEARNWARFSYETFPAGIAVPPCFMDNDGHLFQRRVYGKTMRELEQMVPLDFREFFWSFEIRDLQACNVMKTADGTLWLIDYNI
jgi:hypothetical protein